MPADLPAVRPGQLERLGGDAGHMRVKIGEQDPGQFQAALIGNQAARRGRPVPARVMPPSRPGPELAYR
jgi:hypothetical protein